MDSQQIFDENVDDVQKQPSEMNMSYETISLGEI